MFLVNKVFQFLTPIFLILTIEMLLVRETMLWIFAPIVFVLVIITLWLLNKKKVNKELINFLIGPFLYVVSCVGFALFIEKNIFFHLFAGVVGIFLFIYLGRILDYKFYPKRYQPYSLENFSWYLDILTIFLFYSFLYALITFLKVEFAYLLIAVVMVGLLLSYQLFWVNKIKFSDSSVFVFSIAVILGELFVAIVYLPTSFFVNAFILTIAFYLMSGLARYFLIGSLEKKRIFNFIIVSVLCLILILASAQWV